MSDFVEQLRLAEKAAEDIYFAKINRELIESLHKQRPAAKDSCQSADLPGKPARPKYGPGSG